MREREINIIYIIFTNTGDCVILLHLQTACLKKDEFSVAMFLLHQPKAFCPLGLPSLFIKGRGRGLKSTRSPRSTRTPNHHSVHSGSQLRKHESADLTRLSLPPFFKAYSYLHFTTELKYNLTRIYKRNWKTWNKCSPGPPETKKLNELFWQMHFCVSNSVSWHLWYRSGTWCRKSFE